MFILNSVSIFIGLPTQIQQIKRLNPSFKKSTYGQIYEREQQNQVGWNKPWFGQKHQPCTQFNTQGESLSLLVFRYESRVIEPEPKP